MIVIDANVVSETVRREPDPKVVAWLDAQTTETLYISAVSMAELLLGVALLPEGRRKAALDAALQHQVVSLFGSRILPFDLAAAKAFASLIAAARTAGRAIGTADGQIAATALSVGMAVATRDVAPFEGAGLTVINPWLYEAVR